MDLAEKAEWCRKKAEDAVSPQERATWLFMAQFWHGKVIAAQAATPSESQNEPCDSSLFIC
jgi:hypothetical protein